MQWDLLKSQIVSSSILARYSLRERTKCLSYKTLVALLIGFMKQHHSGMSGYANEIYDFAKECGVSADGLVRIKALIDSWGELKEDSIVYHWTPANWINHIIVRSYFDKKYTCRWEKAEWNDIDQLPFTPEAKTRILSIRDCKKCFKKCSNGCGQEVVRAGEHYLHKMEFGNKCKHLMLPEIK